MRKKIKENQPELVKSDLSKLKSREKIKEIVRSQNDELDQVYEVVEREILPEKIVCPDCGGITLQGLDFCDKCGGELNNYNN
jgi:uncharacterized protein with PIN domain